MQEGARHEKCARGQGMPRGEYRIVFARTGGPAPRARAVGTFEEGGFMGEEMPRGLSWWQVAALASAGAVGALAVFNWLSDLGVGKPENSLGGESGRYNWEHGAVWYTVKGQGEPLVLIHGV